MDLSGLQTGFITNRRCRKVGRNGNFYLLTNFFGAIAFFAKTQHILCKAAGIFILMGNINSISLFSIAKIPVHIT